VIGGTRPGLTVAESYAEITEPSLEDVVARFATTAPPVHRVNERELADLGDQVVLAARPAEERVLGEHVEYDRGSDLGDRCYPAERPRVLISSKVKRMTSRSLMTA
jgi:hypothetical protein